MTRDRPKRSPKGRPRPDRKITLRQLLIVPFLLQIAAAVGLVSYFSFKNGQEAVNLVSAQLRREIDARIQERLEAYLEIPHAINRLNADALQLGTLSLQDRDRLASVFWQQLRVFERTSLIYAGTRDGQYTGAAREGGDLTVDFADAEAGEVYRLYAPDERGYPGELVRDTGQRYDPRQRPWYEATLAADSPVWSSVYPFFSSFQEPVLGITATRPIRDADDRIAAIAAVDLSLGAIGDFLASLQYGKTGQGFLLERSGLLLAASGEAPLFLEAEDGELRRLPGEASEDPVVRGVSRQLEARFGSLDRIAQAQQFDATLDGERLFVNVSPFRDPYGIDWLTVVVVPEADFMAQIDASRRTAILLCLLTLALAAAIGIALAYWVTAPVAKIETASQAIADGNWGEPVRGNGIAELESLAAAFNRMAEQLKTAFATLEQRVRDRTAELVSAREKAEAARREIAHLNAQLETENLRMSAELEVARQLHAMTLPEPEDLADLADLDVAGFMEAAREIGGDYYDAIRQGDRVTFCIGDATGHGLQSGVLAIVAQSALRTLCALDDRDPVKILTTLNQTVFQNTRRMGDQRRNLTLVLLHYEEGRLTVAGQHEEVLVVRADGAIERVDTVDLGFPVGLVEDISGFVAQHDLWLNPGDGIVLYTDGITEAESPDRRFYGIEPLMAAIRSAWAQPAAEVCAAIVADVRRHAGSTAVRDDMTLMVLKRKGFPQQSG